MQTPPANNRIRSQEVRVIDVDGKNLGILPLDEAINKAREKELDLIQVTEKVEPPVCKIGNYGKYLYSTQKKERKMGAKRVSILKIIRLSFNISAHDMETKARKTREFLEKGDRVRIEMLLRGRQITLQDFAREKIRQFLTMIEKETNFKIDRELKKEGRGLALIIAKA